MIQSWRNGWTKEQADRRTTVISWDAVRLTLSVQKNKMKITIEFHIFELLQIPNFSLKQTILILWKDTSIQKHKD